MNNILALDYSCIQYILYYRGYKYWQENLQGKSPSSHTYWQKARDSFIQSLVKATGANPQIVGLVDQKQQLHNGTIGYWRHQLYPDYKGGRPIAESYTPFKEYTKLLMHELKYPVLKIPGLEADDWFGILARLKSPETKLWGATLDGDWALCCAYENVRIINLHYKSFGAVLGQAEALEKFSKSLRADILDLSEVPEIKSRKGEKSDNLAKGFDARLADLVNYSGYWPEDLDPPLPTEEDLKAELRKQKIKL